MGGEGGGDQLNYQLKQGNAHGDRDGWERYQANEDAKRIELLKVIQRKRRGDDETNDVGGDHDADDFHATELKTTPRRFG